MRYMIDAKEAFTPDGGIATIYEYEQKADQNTTTVSYPQLPVFNHFELADGRKLTMVGHGEYKADQTGDVYIVKGETSHTIGSDPEKTGLERQDVAEAQEIGGFDAKNDAAKRPKDAAGKAMGYEDDETSKRDSQYFNEKV